MMASPLFGVKTDYVRYHRHSLILARGEALLDFDFSLILA
jgi:hypothetical protein